MSSFSQYDSFLLRFLYSHSFNYKNALKAVLLNIQATKDRIENPVIYTPKLTEILQSKGITYFSGLDHVYRPILVINPFKAEKAHLLDVTLKIAFIDRLINYSEERLFIDGKTETWTILIDLNQKGYFTIKGFWEKIKSFFKFSGYILTRVYRIYFLNSSTSFKLMSKLGGTFNKFIKSKIRISTSNSHPEMWTHINPFQVEQKYRGKLQNLTQYWPPTVSNSKFTTEKQGSISHIDEKSYFNQVKDGKISSTNYHRTTVDKFRANNQ